MKINNKIDKYITGIIESRGIINLPVNSGLKDIDRPNMIISFNMKDKPLVIKLISIIGGGIIYDIPNMNEFNLIFNDDNVMLNIVMLMNGNMRTNKVKKLKRLID
jgi:hypothetical protein